MAGVAEQTTGGEPQSHTNVEVAEMLPDQARAAAANGSLTDPICGVCLGGESVKNQGALPQKSLAEGHGPNRCIGSAASGERAGGGVACCGA